MRKLWKIHDTFKSERCCRFKRPKFFDIFFVRTVFVELFFFSDHFTTDTVKGANILS